MTAWWFAVEPVEDDVVWALSAREGVLAAGLVPDASALRRELLAALPGSDNDPDLWSGTWADPEREADLARRAGATLVPPAVRDRLGAQAVPPAFHIAARGWLASVPWDLLVVGPGPDERLLERARVVGAFPSTVERAITPPPVGGPTIRVVDPGPTSTGRLYPETPTSWWERCTDNEVVLPLPGGALGTDALSATLREERAVRLVYFGHGVGGTPEAPAGAGLVLTGADGTPEVFTAHRWLGDPTAFPSPPRVAIIACGSDDGRHIEQSGLPVAATHAGAEIVTATRWTVPVDADRGEECPATVLGLAVDAAHAASDPLNALRTWQLERLEAWRAHGHRDDAPLLWAALVTYLNHDD